MTRWTAAEEERLRALVAAAGEPTAMGAFKGIAESLGTGRSHSGVFQHWEILQGRRSKRNVVKPVHDVAAEKVHAEETAGDGQLVPAAPAATGADDADASAAKAPAKKKTGRPRKNGLVATVLPDVVPDPTGPIVQAALAKPAPPPEAAENGTAATPLPLFAAADTNFRH